MWRKRELLSATLNRTDDSIGFQAVASLASSGGVRRLWMSVSVSIVPGQVPLENDVVGHIAEVTEITRLSLASG